MNKREDNIKMDLQKVLYKGVGCNQAPQYKVQEVACNEHGNEV